MRFMRHRTMNLGLDRSKPVIRLLKVGETETGLTWIFTFFDPVHRFTQSIVVVKDVAEVGRKVEERYEQLWCNWQNEIKAKEMDILLAPIMNCGNISPTGDLHN